MDARAVRGGMRCLASGWAGGPGVRPRPICHRSMCYHSSSTTGVQLHCMRTLQGCARRPPADAGTIGAAARGGRPAVCRRPGSLVQQGTHRRQSGVSGGAACCAAVAGCCGMLHVVGTDLQHLIRLGGPDLLELLGCLLSSSCCFHRACAPFLLPSPTHPPSAA